MAIAYANVGGTNGSTSAGTSGVVTITGTVTVGMLLVIAVGLVGASPTSITDNSSGGNNWYRIAPATTNTETITFYGCIVKNVPTTVTANFASSRWGAVVEAYTGVAALSFPKGAATGAASPATITGTEVATNNWQLAAFTNKGTATWSASTGNLRRNIAGGGTTTPGVAIVDNTTTTTAAAESASNVWAGCCVELLAVNTKAKLSTLGCGI
jgi:hypothetical protein